MIRPQLHFLAVLLLNTFYIRRLGTSFSDYLVMNTLFRYPRSRPLVLIVKSLSPRVCSSSRACLLGFSSLHLLISWSAGLRVCWSSGLLVFPPSLLLVFPPIFSSFCFPTFCEYHSDCLLTGFFPISFLLLPYLPLVAQSL